MDTHCFRGFVGVLSAMVTLLLGTVVYQQDLVPSIYYGHAQSAGPQWRTPPPFPGFSLFHVPDASDYGDLFSWASVFNNTVNAPPGALPMATIPSTVITITEISTIAATAYINPELELVQEWVQDYVDRTSLFMQIKASYMFQTANFLWVLFRSLVSNLINLSGYVALHCLYFEGYVWENWQHVLEQWAAFLPTQWSADDTPYWLCLWRIVYVHTFLVMYSPVLLYQFSEDPERFTKVLNHLFLRLRDTKSTKTPHYQCAGGATSLIDKLVLRLNTSHKRSFASFNGPMKNRVPGKFKRSRYVYQGKENECDTSRPATITELIEASDSGPVYHTDSAAKSNGLKYDKFTLGDLPLDKNTEQSSPAPPSQFNHGAVAPIIYDPHGPVQVYGNKPRAETLSRSTRGISNGAVDGRLVNEKAEPVISLLKHDTSEILSKTASVTGLNFLSTTRAIKGAADGRVISEIGEHSSIVADKRPDRAQSAEVPKARSEGTPISGDSTGDFDNKLKTKHVDLPSSTASSAAGCDELRLNLQTDDGESSTDGVSNGAVEKEVEHGHAKSDIHMLASESGYLEIAENSDNEVCRSSITGDAEVNLIANSTKPVTFSEVGGASLSYSHESDDEEDVAEDLAKELVLNVVDVAVAWLQADEVTELQSSGTDHRYSENDWAHQAFESHGQVGYDQAIERSKGARSDILDPNSPNSLAESEDASDIEPFETDKAQEEGTTEKAAVQNIYEADLAFPECAMSSPGLEGQFRGVPSEKAAVEDANQVIAVQLQRTCSTEIPATLIDHLPDKNSNAAAIEQQTEARSDALGRISGEDRDIGLLDSDSICASPQQQLEAHLDAAAKVPQEVGHPYKNLKPMSFAQTATGTDFPPIPDMVIAKPTKIRDYVTSGVYSCPSEIAPTYYSSLFIPRYRSQCGITFKICLPSGDISYPQRTAYIPTTLPSSVGGDSLTGNVTAGKPFWGLYMNSTTSFIKGFDGPFRSPRPIVKLPTDSAVERTEPFSEPPVTESEKPKTQSTEIFYVGRLTKEDTPKRQHRGGRRVHAAKAESAERWAQMRAEREKVKRAEKEEAKKAREERRKEASKNKKITTSSSPVPLAQVIPVPADPSLDASYTLNTVFAYRDSDYFEVLEHSDGSSGAIDSDNVETRNAADAVKATIDPKPLRNLSPKPPLHGNDTSASIGANLLSNERHEAIHLEENAQPMNNANESCFPSIIPPEVQDIEDSPTSSIPVPEAQDETVPKLETGNVTELPAEKAVTAHQAENIDRSALARANSLKIEGDTATISSTAPKAEEDPSTSHQVGPLPASIKNRSYVAIRETWCETSDSRIHNIDTEKQMRGSKDTTPPKAEEEQSATTGAEKWSEHPCQSKEYKSVGGSTQSHPPNTQHDKVTQWRPGSLMDQLMKKAADQEEVKHQKHAIKEEETASSSPAAQAGDMPAWKAITMNYISKPSPQSKSRKPKTMKGKSIAASFGVNSLDGQHCADIKMAAQPPAGKKENEVSTALLKPPTIPVMPAQKQQRGKKEKTTPRAAPALPKWLQNKVKAERQQEVRYGGM